jgi:hypothetical protein
MVRARKPPVRDWESDDEETQSEEREEQEQPPTRPVRKAAAKAPASRAQGQGASRGGASRGGAKGDAGGSSRGVDKGKGKQPARRSKRPQPPSDSEEDVAPPSPSSLGVTDLVLHPATLPRGYEEPFGAKSKRKMQTIRKLRYTNPDTFDDESEDFRFASFFQAHFYNTVILSKDKNPVLDQKFIDWKTCEKLNDPDLRAALVALENKGFKDIMSFRQYWNEEVIAQFYSTLWLTHAEEETNIPAYMHFFIQGIEYKCSYTRFAKILGLPWDNTDFELLHKFEKPRDEDLHLYHIDPTRPWVATNLKPYYRYLNLLFRQTVMPKGGDEAYVRGTSQVILSFFTPGNETKISVFDIIWREIIESACDVKRSCTHAPYIMKMILCVTKIRFETLWRHDSYVPKVIPRPAVANVQSSGEPSPSRPLHPSSSRAAQASRPMTHTRQARQSTGLGRTILRAAKSIFSMCRDISAENAHTQRRQQQLDENFRRYSAGERVDTIPQLSPARPSQFGEVGDLEAYHLQRFGEPLYSDEEDQGPAAEDEIQEHTTFGGPYPYHGYMPPASSDSQEWDSWSHPPSAPSSSYRGWNG